MLSQIEEFVNWVRRRNPQARTWRDYSLRPAPVRRCRSATARPARSPSATSTASSACQVAQGFKPATVNRRLAAILALLRLPGRRRPGPGLSRPASPPLPARAAAPATPGAGRGPAALLRRRIEQTARDRAMFILMLRCGLRIGEVASLLLRRPVPGRACPAPGGARQGLAASARCTSPARPSAPCARTWRNARLPPATSSSSATSCDGLSTTAIHKRLMRYREQAGVRLTAHRLRHSFANDLLSAGAPVTSIQKLLGHRWLETTQIYVQANDQTRCRPITMPPA